MKLVHATTTKQYRKKAGCTRLELNVILDTILQEPQYWPAGG